MIEKNSSTDGSVSFITQGDTNDVPDATPIRDVQIHGTVWYRIPMLGWVNNWFNGEKRDIVVPTAAGALILYALWNLAVGVRDRRRKKFETHPEVDANPTTAPDEPLADARTGPREP